MGIFEKRIAEVGSADLQELIGKEENLRLEFRPNCDKRDDLLKKVSGMANAFGGHIVYGVEDTDNKATQIIGVPKDPDFGTKVSLWCHQGLYPPVVVEVGPEIPVAANRYSYVIRVPESPLAPHFIEGRGGCYQRVHEASGKLEYRLADWRWLELLANRRELALKLAHRTRSSLAERAVRYRAYLDKQVKYDGQYVRMIVSAGPRFVTGAGVPLDKLVAFAQGKSITWPRGRFPSTASISSHSDAVSFPAATGDALGFLQISQYAHVHYTYFLQPRTSEAQLRFDSEDDEEKFREQPWIDSVQLLKHILLGVGISAKVFESIEKMSILDLEVALEGTRGKWFFSVDEYNRASCPAKCTFDDEVAVSEEVRGEQFINLWKTPAASLWRQLLFALGEKKALTRSNYEGCINRVSSTTY